jgi:hypothetical protein
MAGASLVFVAPAFSNTLTFQGVTFETIASGNTLTLVITNALSGGTDNWTNINYLSAFEIKEVGNVTGVTLGAGFDGSWNYTVDSGLASSVGCTTGGTPGGCFYRDPALALSDSMSFTMTFAGTSLDYSAPHLKIQFLTNLNQTKATGDLLSLSIGGVPAIPEPEIYAMMAVGLGVLGWSARRRKSKVAAAG